MTRNYIQFNDVKLLLQYLRKFQASDIYFKDIYFRVVILIRLLFQLAFKVDRGQLINHIDKLISETEKAEDDGIRDYNLIPLTPSQNNELEDISNELILNDLEENKDRQIKAPSHSLDLDEFEYWKIISLPYTNI